MHVAMMASLIINLEKEVFLLNAIRHAINEARFNRVIIFSKIVCRSLMLQGFLSLVQRSGKRKKVRLLTFCINIEKLFLRLQPKNILNADIVSVLSCLPAVAYL